MYKPLQLLFTFVQICHLNDLNKVHVLYVFVTCVADLVKKSSIFDPSGQMLNVSQATARGLCWPHTMQIVLGPAGQLYSMPSRHPILISVTI